MSISECPYKLYNDPCLITGKRRDGCPFPLGKWVKVGDEVLEKHRKLYPGYGGLMSEDPAIVALSLCAVMVSHRMDTEDVRRRKREKPDQFGRNRSDYGVVDF